jgi:hypothetical protein
MSRTIARVLALLGLLTALPAAGGAYVPLADAVREYGPDDGLAPLDKSFQMALIDTGWSVVAVAEHEVTAESRTDHQYAKVRVRFGERKATFTLLESENLGQKECRYFKQGKPLRGPCIEEQYYERLDRIVSALPLAHARVVFLQSLIGPGVKP